MKAINQIGIRVIMPKELLNKLTRAAKKRRISRLALIRLALSEWLDQAEKQSWSGKLGSQNKPNKGR